MSAGGMLRISQMCSGNRGTLGITQPALPAGSGQPQAPPGAWPRIRHKPSLTRPLWGTGCSARIWQGNPQAVPPPARHSPTPTPAGARGCGLQAINILQYLFGKASDFFMTLNHQRLSTQLVLAAARYLKSSMCFRALINQGIAERNLKIKNIQRCRLLTLHGSFA